MVFEQHLPRDLDSRPTPRIFWSGKSRSVRRNVQFYLGMQGVNCVCWLHRYEMLDLFHAWMQEKTTREENLSLCIPVTTWEATRYCINNCVLLNFQELIQIFCVPRQRYNDNIRCSEIFPWSCVFCSPVVLWVFVSKGAAAQHCRTAVSPSHGRASGHQSGALPAQRESHHCVSSSAVGIYRGEDKIKWCGPTRLFSPWSRIQQSDYHHRASWDLLLAILHILRGLKRVVVL